MQKASFKHNHLFYETPLGIRFLAKWVQQEFWLLHPDVFLKIFFFFCILKVYLIYNLTITYTFYWFLLHVLSHFILKSLARTTTAFHSIYWCLNSVQIFSKSCVLALEILARTQRLSWWRNGWRIHLQYSQ